MTTMGWIRSWAVVAVVGMVGASGARGAALTADEAVKIALSKSTDVLIADANIRGARGSAYSAWGAVVPDLSLIYSRRESRQFGPDSRSNSTTPGLSTSWGILNLASWKNLSAARQDLRASRLEWGAARNDVALRTRQQFYSVVQSIKLAEVAAGALKRSRDDERRVRAMFEVGSVSRSDLLKAQVASAQAELDSITATNDIVDQRVALATQIGVPESEIGEVDTLLAVSSPQAYDEQSIYAEAARNRPDLIAAEARLRAAGASHSAARMARLPYVVAQGSATFNAKGTTVVGNLTFPSSTDRQYSGFVSLNWDIFDLRSIDASVAGARASLERQRATTEALRRNLRSEVHQALLAYNEAVAGNRAAQRGDESAVENLKLTQEKYNVGSATILELIDAQVQLQTAQSNVVKALAAIRVAEAQISRVRGQPQ